MTEQPPDTEAQKAFNAKIAEEPSFRRRQAG
jgi:hypothetical protein